MVWCGSGVGFGGSPLPPLWRGVGWFPPACLDLLGVFGKPMLMMILMMMMTIIVIIIITIILVFLWLVVGYLLPTCLLTIMALLILVTVDGTLTGESCLKNVHCHTDRASWDAILVTVVAFGALMWKKCAQSHSFDLGRVGGGVANRERG